MERQERRSVTLARTSNSGAPEDGVCNRLLQWARTGVHVDMQRLPR